MRALISGPPVQAREAGSGADEAGGRAVDVAGKDNLLTRHA